MKNYVEKYPLTNDEKIQINNCEKKHLVCKEKKSGKLLLMNPLEINDWNEHYERCYSLDGDYWLDCANQNNQIGE